MDRVRHQTTSTARYGSRKVISRPKWRRRHYCRGWSVKLIGEFAHDGYARHILSPYAVETHQHVAHRSSARSSTDGWAVMVQYDINSVTCRGTSFTRVHKMFTLHPVHLIRAPALQAPQGLGGCPSQLGGVLHSLLEPLRNAFLPFLFWRSSYHVHAAGLASPLPPARACSFSQARAIPPARWRS